MLSVFNNSADGVQCQCCQCYMSVLTVLDVSADSGVLSRQTWAVAVAKLVERSLQTQEICISNPVIVKLYITYIMSTELKRRK